MYSVINADAVQWAIDYKRAGGELFHAILCDPPYHLTSIVNRFGGENSKPATGGVYGRSAAGFMGKQWDGGDLAFRPETWRAFYDILHAGAFGMAFAGSRGWHRQAVAIEDAGFIIHPTTFLWAFASGFPKATRLDGQIDRDAGAKRHDKIKGGHIGMSKGGGDNSNAGALEVQRKIPSVIGKGNLTNGTPITPLAEQWAGHRYGLQALKPAVEPIIVFQKPYSGRPVDCITSTGAGALWIDGGRIGTEEITTNGGEKFKGDGIYNKFTAQETTHAGRWPSNFILQHLPDCNGTCAAGCPVEAIGRQSGESVSKPHLGGKLSGENTHEGWKRPSHKDNYLPFSPHDDAGTAARFFFNSDFVAERIEESDAVFYVAKASRSERDAGLDGLPAIKPVYNGKNSESAGLAAGSVEDKFSTSPRRNSHPTLKPIKLTTHLATLLLPPPAYKPRLLVPFAGAGSEMIGAILAGWHEVIGLEREPEYIEIAEKRLAYWSDKPAGHKPKLPKRESTESPADNPAKPPAVVLQPALF